MIQQLPPFFPPRLVALLNAVIITLERNSFTLDDVGELLVTVILLLIGFSASYTKPSTTSFVERDPSLSQPTSINGDAVPTSLLILYAVLFPALTSSSILTLQWMRADKKDRARILRRSIWISLSFAQAFGVALAATNVLKNAVARQRPSFFAMINYAGYADGKCFSLSFFFFYKHLTCHFLPFQLFPHHKARLSGLLILQRHPLQITNLTILEA